MSSRIWQHLRHSAKVRNLVVDIDKEYLEQLFKKQNSICPYSGVKLKFSDTLLDVSTGTASVDRIESSKGYVKGNVQWVHKHVNVMKHKHTEEEFLRWCAVITDYQRSKAAAFSPS